ncbi:endonuclease domain-containing protein [Arenivirga flava]|uniref:DUF559 domain-containing protein n=1 Tax=Arenivirga flava TaxID=1930060 RepID=A0AA37UFH5_9MICO|nr:DUF559 domain-containing protein [Arenivirga flava]GMA28088.1 hypothetical protein GCM10025874_13410 [Arenivirga flava]
MPRVPEPLPPPLQGAPFGVAAAGGLGISRARLRASDLDAPHHGVRALRGRALSPWELAVPLLGEHRYFGGATAAHLWGCPLPAHAAAVVHIVDPRRAPRHADVEGHRASSIDRVVERSGVRVTDPPSTWLALARVLELDDLVACGDHLVHDPPQLDPADPWRPHTTIAVIAARMEGYRGRGIRVAREALALLSTAAESRPESHLRLLLLRAGMTDVLVNPEILDERGRFIARSDLVFLAEKVAVEYDGDQHRTSLAQYEHDRVRQQRMREAGWAIVDVRARALYGDPQGVVRRVRRALGR